MIKYLITLLLGMSSMNLSAQNTWIGQVLEQNGTPVFAANVYPKNAPEQGTITDFDGRFELSLTFKFDTLVVSYIGFDSQFIALRNKDDKEELTIKLQRAAQSLAMITIKGSDPISSQFSVQKLDKMDVYLNPVAQGDPLKAITILPASTTTDESANPSLRGSSADRSRVILNGVPIYNPVRSSQLNNQGFFSIFNPEIIEEMQVYASNPPLIYGNSSAGLVDIQTSQSLRENQFQLSAHLTGAGLFLSRQLKQDSSFLQAYSNWQFSDAFIGLNRANIPRLKGFNTKDLGLNFRWQLSPRWAFNSLHYAIDEGYDFLAASLSFEALASAQKQRYFTVNNFVYKSLAGILSVNMGYNTSTSRFTQANLRTRTEAEQSYLGINYKHLAGRDLVWQVGVSFDYQNQQTRDSIPLFFFAIDPEAPSYFQARNMSLLQAEGYAFSSWEATNDWTFSAGIRLPLAMDEVAYPYFNYQAASKYQIRDQDHLLLSAGQYHSFSTPSFFIPSYQLLKAQQVALEYSYEQEMSSWQAAIYAKKEQGEVGNNGFFAMDQLSTVGIEASYQQQVGKYWQWTLANAYIRQRMQVDGSVHTGPRDFDYFFKGSLQYQNPNLFTVALTYLSQPGNPYTPIEGSVFVEELGGFRPLFSSQLNSARFGNYHRFDLNISRYFQFDRYSLVAFASVANIFNQRNERDLLFTADYSSYDFDYYQLRSFFAGLVWQWN
ncbi:MAG: carboxypeptidase-like regulatory domain-containing protein [Saprospiraceae bacterium]|nr:carboxypeptidase-like regulatory domain-containing protein [Saprospiraceae bacterium]